METRNTARKGHFSGAEIDIITSENENNKFAQSASLRSGIRGSHEAAVWNKITAALNSVGVDKRTPAKLEYLISFSTLIKAG